MTYRVLYVLLISSFSFLAKAQTNNMYSKQPVNLEIADTLKDYKLISRVFQNIILSINSNDSNIDQQLSQLTEPQRTVYYSTLLDMQVLNGGISQFFGNYQDKYNNQIIDALINLQMDEHKLLFQDVCNSEQTEELFKKFDSQYYKLNSKRSVNNYLKEYIIDHIDDFKN